jgi:hypothetical protein
MMESLVTEFQYGGNGQECESFDIYIKADAPFSTALTINNHVAENIFEGPILAVEDHPDYGPVVVVWAQTTVSDYADFAAFLSELPGVVAVEPSTEGSKQRAVVFSGGAPILAQG